MQIIDNIFKIEHNNIKPQQGRVLISVPFLKDLFFKKSVILLTEYNSEGAFGFILNKPYDYKLHEILDNVPESDIPVSYGGPVSNDTLHFIHTLGDSIPNTTQISKHLYWGGDFEYIINLIREGEIPENKIRFFIGYSGWAKGQLETEISQNTWLVGNMQETSIMHSNEEKYWNDSLKQLGEKYAIWSNFPDDPKLN